jgi:hypothetical protein
VETQKGSRGNTSTTPACNNIQNEKQPPKAKELKQQTLSYAQVAASGGRQKVQHD